MLTYFNMYHVCVVSGLDMSSCIIHISFCISIRPIILVTYMVNIMKSACQKHGFTQWSQLAS